MFNELIKAIKQGNKDRVQDLIEKQPDILRADNSTISPILLSIYAGKREITEMLVDTGIALTIHEAAAYGDLERVSQILKQESDQVDSYSTDGFTALGLAAYLGHHPVVKILLEHGADINRASQNMQAVTPLHSATSANQVEIINTLLANGADINLPQERGLTPLMQAAHRGDIELTRQFLAHGADPTAMTVDGKTALSYAQEVDAQEIINLLMQE